MKAAIDHLQPLSICPTYRTLPSSPLGFWFSPFAEFQFQLRTVFRTPRMLFSRADSARRRCGGEAVPPLKVALEVTVGLRIILEKRDLML